MNFFDNLRALTRKKDDDCDELIDLINYNASVVGIKDMAQEMVECFKCNQSCECIYLDVDECRVMAWQLELSGYNNYPYTYLLSNKSIIYVEYSLLDRAKKGITENGELDCVLPLERIDVINDISVDEQMAKWIMSITEYTYRCFVDIHIRMDKQNKKNLFFYLLNH